MRKTPLHPAALSFSKLKDTFGEPVVVVTITTSVHKELGAGEIVEVEKIAKIDFDPTAAITPLRIDDSSKKLKFVYIDSKGKAGKRKLKDVHIPLLDRGHWHDNICVLPLDVAHALKAELTEIPRPKMDWTFPSTSKQLIGLST